MGDFFAFRRMITPAVIQSFFWLGVIVCVVTGLEILSNSDMLAAASPVPPTLTAVLVLVVGPLLVRIYCERAPDGALPDLRIAARHRAEPGAGAGAARALRASARPQRRTKAGCTQAMDPPESSTRART